MNDQAMKNIQLNPGGVIGAILLLAVVIIMVILTSDPNKVGSRVGGVGVLAVFLGAAGGNYVWDRCFPKNK
jgi:hypothetical protein